jgi:hypothetical protein
LLPGLPFGEKDLLRDDGGAELNPEMVEWERMGVQSTNANLNLWCTP